MILFAAAAPLSISAAEVSLLIILALSIILVVLHPSKLKLVRLNSWEWALVIFVFLSFISCLVGTAPKESLRDFHSEFLISLYIIYSRMVISKRHFDLILLVFVIFSFLTAVIGIWQYVHSASEIGFRAVGTRNLPLTYAESLLFAIALAIPFCNDKKALQKMGRIAILLIFVGGLVVTKSRGPWVAFLLMLAVYEGVRKRFFPWRTLVLSIFLVVSAKVLNGSFSIRLLSITDIHNDLSIADRLYMWKMGGHMFLDRPFWGYGIGTIGKNFMKLEQKYGSIRLYQDSPIPMVWGELHNTYLNLAVERGFPSLICLLAFVSLIVKNLWRYIEDPTTMGIFLGLIGFLVAGLTECVYNDSEIAMLFYMFLGLSVARTRMLDSSESRTDKF